MENIEIKKFIKEIITLTKSLIIKIEDLAIKENDLLKNYGFQVDDNKTTWRYYLNLSGEYHSTDTLMYVTSLDNGEEILFNKENLLLHPITKRYYNEKTYRYNLLVDKYSGQQELINGILNPIDINEAIEAPNYKILRHDSSLVQSNEHHLMIYLQNWITTQFKTYMQVEYKYTDNLFLTSFLGDIYTKLPMVIFNLRLDAVHTWQAHDFHIWSHINSYGDFTKFKKYLNDYQKFWLYKNIDYLKKNSGKNETLDLLIENLLTKRKIPLSYYDLIVDTSKQLEQGLPELIFRKYNINFNENIDITESLKEPNYIINKETNLAVENSVMKDQYLSELINKNKIIENSNLPTKTFESEVTDFSNSGFETLIRCCLWHSIYLSKNGLYEAIIDVRDPVKGKKLKLNVKDAITLWSILIDNAYVYGNEGLYQKEIPYLYYYKCFKITPPMPNELRQFGDVDYLPNKLLSDITKIGVDYDMMFSPSLLYQKCEEVFELYWKYKKMYSQYYDFVKQEAIYSATEHMFENGICRLTDYTLKQQFLNELELDIDSYSYDDLTYLAWDIFSTFTGWNLNTHVTLESIQGNLIDLMLKLSSYSIHVIRDTIVGNESGNEYRCNLSKSILTYQDVNDDNLYLGYKDGYVMGNSYYDINLPFNIYDKTKTDLSSEARINVLIDVYEDCYTNLESNGYQFETKLNEYSKIIEEQI